MACIISAHEDAQCHSVHMSTSQKDLACVDHASQIQIVRPIIPDLKMHGVPVLQFISICCAAIQTLQATQTASSIVAM